MANSLMEYLLNAPSGADRLSSLLGMVQQKYGTTAAGSSDPNVGGGGGGGGSGTVNYPDGDTKYKYTEYDRSGPNGYTGVPANMVTRFGITLQPGPMHSLMDIAKASPIMPGAKEIGMILQGYRSYAAQAAAGGTISNPGGYNPNATTAGSSFHGQGLAIDAGEWTARQRLARALAAAGWNQLPSESWHWSYGVSG